MSCLPLSKSSSDLLGSYEFPVPNLCGCSCCLDILSKWDREAQGNRRADSKTYSVHSYRPCTRRSCHRPIVYCASAKARNPPGGCRLMPMEHHVSVPSSPGHTQTLNTLASMIEAVVCITGKRHVRGENLVSERIGVIGQLQIAACARSPITEPPTGPALSRSRLSLSQALHYLNYIRVASLDANAYYDKSFLVRLL